MMSKARLIGAILLVVGTAIGSGMMALPLVLSPLGLLPSVILMFLVWGVSYYTALANLELNIQAGGGLSLGKLALHYQCPRAEYLGTLSLKVLSYALMVVFIYGGTQILMNLLESVFAIQESFAVVASVYSVFLLFLLMGSVRWVDYANRVLFTGLFFVLFTLLWRLMSNHISNISPLIFFQESVNSSWLNILPVVFTSFGFHVIFHTLTKYCNNNVRTLKHVFFWGSLIPVLIYITWTLVVILSLYSHVPNVYHLMVKGEIDLGSLVKALSMVTKWPLIQVMFWLVTILAIVTSAIGVGLGLIATWQGVKFIKSQSNTMQKFSSLFFTIFMPFILTITIPNAFINLLSFAGMILVIIAIVIPLYLLGQPHVVVQHYPILKFKFLKVVVMLFGGGVVACELISMSGLLKS